MRLFEDVLDGNEALARKEDGTEIVYRVTM
jgi:hypothetical protein